jgi:hypothetical protein
MATSSDKISEAAKALGYTLAEVELIYSERGDPDKRQAIEVRAAQLARESWRANYLPSPQFYLLQQACRLVNDAFGSMCYLVGSSLVRRDYRDVDVRLMLDDEAFARTFPGITNAWYLHPLWSLMCCSISRHLQEASGLPIDFQIQQRTKANEESGGKARLAIGIFHSLRNHEQYPGGGE